MKAIALLCRRIEWAGARRGDSLDRRLLIEHTQTRAPLLGARIDIAVVNKKGAFIFFHELAPS